MYQIQRNMDYIKIILCLSCFSFANSNEIPKDFISDLLNPVKLLNSPESEVLESLSSVGLDNDVIERPAKKLLLHVYDQLTRGEDIRETTSKRGRNKRIEAADTIRSLTSKVPNYEGNGRVRLTFNLTSFSATELADHAELHIRPLRHQQNTHHRLKLTVRGDKGRKGEKYTVRVASKSKSYQGYLVFDITDVIQKAIATTTSDVLRLLDVTVMHRAKRNPGRRANRERKSNAAYNTIRSVQANPRNLREDDGLLVVYSQDKQFIKDFKKYVTLAAKNLKVKESRDHHSRQKRDSSKSDKSKRVSSRECDIQDMWVDFVALGWNRWILYPPRYNAHICGGKCTSPVQWRDDPTNHAILQSLMRMSDKKVPRPCCVPTKLGSITMLYHEGEEIVVRRHEEMTVSKCGCR